MTRALLELCRISNLPTVWTNVIAAWVIAGGGARWRPELLWLLLGASLVYSAGMILNDTFDAAWDRKNRPARPIASGRIELRTAWTIGAGGLVGGYAVMVFAGGANWGVTGWLLGAIVLYDAYHKPWAGSVLVMGSCRTLLYLAAGSAFVGSSCKSDVIWALLGVSGAVLGTYIVALSLIARAEAKGNASNAMRFFMRALLMLPVAWALWIWSQMQPAIPPFGLIAGIVVLLSFLLWTHRALQQMRKGGPAIGEAVGLLLAGIPLVDALMISPTSPVIACGFCFLPPILRYWQRWVAAT
ncbi:MAG: UbiA prenyltransferase [Verrucomicrobiaceae bacterium]|nr:UbiA prenyltransferase [Verrucomicrobiaceae bacterium]